MKKLKLFILASLMIGAVSVAAGCSKGDALAQPTGVEYDIENELTWEPVDNAKSYLVEIKNVETGEVKSLSAKRTSPKVDLSILAQGNYEIRVKALGRDGETEGEWSKTIHFEKGYETGCVYTLINDNTEYAISKFGTATGRIYIEDEYRGKPVTEISARAFKGYSEIEYVHVGDNVKKIGDNAFYNCKNLKGVYFSEESALTAIGVGAFQQCGLLEEISIPVGVTTLRDSSFAYCRSLKEIALHDNLTAIEGLAFSDCSGLTNVVIPDSVTFLGSSAFSGCSGLQTLTIGEGLNVINSSVFYKCSALTEINFPTQGNLTSIGAGAFSECTALPAVTIPEGVTDIAANAFSMTVEVVNEEDGTQTLKVHSKLATVDIPSTVNHVGSQAFVGTKLYMDAYMVGDSLIYIDDWLVDASAKAKKELEQLAAEDFKENVYGIADSALSNFANLQGVTLPDTVKYIGDSAFRSNARLKDFYTQPDSIVRIGKYAFMYCTILSNVVFGDGVKSIGEYAFAGCERLKNTEDNVIVPDTVEVIENQAFAGTALQNVDGVIYANNWIVGCDRNTSKVEISEDTIGIATYAFARTKLSNLTIPRRNKLAYIMRGAFYKCESLSAINLSNTTVQTIGDYAFYNCNSLVEISLPESLKTIGRSAFSQCGRLAEIDLSETEVETIGEAAFFECINLEEITFSKTLKEIGRSAFYKCSALQEMDVPNTVKSVGEYAFAHCALLSKATIGNQVKEIGKYAFVNCVSLKRVTIAAGVKSIGDYAFYGCKELLTVSIREALQEGDGLETIGAHAFSGAVKLEKLTLPATLKTIDKQAFRGCASLITIVIPASVEMVNEHAFYGCSAATFYVVDGVDTTDWNKYWNSSYQPTVWGCTLDEEGAYIVSVTIGDGTLSNTWSLDEFGGLEKAGATFAGWATELNGEVVYAANEIVNAPKGATLYACWAE